jgi:hypothetical protein
VPGKEVRRMKRMVLILAGLVLIASPCFAQTDTSYVGLFTDDAHTTWTVSAAGGFTPFTLYMYFLPGANGLIAAEFRLVVPSNVLASTITYKDPDITVELGTLTGGIAVAIDPDHCKPAGAWFKLYAVSCFLTTVDPSLVEIGPNPAANAYQIATCELGYPFGPLKRYTNICCNQDCSIATRRTTWGAIKELF